MFETTTAIVPRVTIEQAVDAWKASAHEIKEGFRLLQTAQDRLKAAFGEQDFCYRMSVLDHNGSRDVDPEAAAGHLLRLKGEAWTVLVEKLQLRQVLSSARAMELDGKLKDPKTLPEIDTDAILGMFESMTDNLQTYITEAVVEVFETLRPAGSSYKTNTEYEIGKRVILSYWIDTTWGGCFRVMHCSEQDCRNLDNVFHLLDGRGPIKSHYGPLYDAIRKTEKESPRGETDFFKFRACLNNNIHIEFKRMDLVAKLNEIAGGNRLRKEPAA